MEKWNEHEWDNLQHVDVSEEEAPCRHCKSDILDVSNFRYANKSVAKPTYWEELCECKKCENSFVMHYDIYDPSGHIFRRVFTEDINNPDYSWQDVLSADQKKNISEHLKNCQICKDRLDSEMLSDAFFSNFIGELKKRLG